MNFKNKARQAGLIALAFVMSFAFLDLDFSYSDGDEQTVQFQWGADTAYAKPGGGRSGGFGGGSRGWSRPTPRPSPRPAPTPRVAPTPTPKTTPKPVTSPKATAPKPAISAAAKAQQRQQSAQKQRLAAAKRAKPMPTAQRAKVYGNRTPVQISRSRTTVINSYPPQQRTVIINRYGGFSDPFDPFFMYRVSLLNVGMMSMFHYHHWNSYDSMRQQQLLSENAELRARMSALEAQGVARNASFVPEDPSLDPALMKTDEYVRADFGLPVEEPGFPWGKAFLWTVLLGGGGFLAYNIFIKREVV